MKYDPSPNATPRAWKSKRSIYARLSLAVLIAVTAFALFVAAIRQSSVAQSSRERQVDNDVPTHVPIKIKLKAEKEKKFKDLDNPNWVRDFEVEVTNTSNKPIYFLELWLELPDTMSESNNPLAFSLRYGRGAFLHPETLSSTTDVPIQPGETRNLTIGETWLRGWEQSKARRHLPDPRKVRIVLVHLSVGDGTGFDGGGEAFPYKRNRATNGSCREGPVQATESSFDKTARLSFPVLREHSLLPKPASIVPEVGCFPGDGAVNDKSLLILNARKPSGLRVFRF